MEQKLDQPIGIFGGTFDPIHFGHLRPCLELCEQFNLEHIRYIPSFIPPHRDNPTIRVEMRVKMVEQAIAGESRFQLDKREIERQGPSYMVDTLKSLRQDFPNHPLGLIIGMDAFLKIHLWQRWQELLNYCHFIVMRRPDSDFEEPSNWPEELKKLHKEHKAVEIIELHKHLCGKIVFQNVTQLAISSTDIRSKLKQNRSIRYLVPDSVLDLISNNHLYL